MCSCQLHASHIVAPTVPICDSQYRLIAYIYFILHDMAATHVNDVRVHLNQAKHHIALVPAAWHHVYLDYCSYPY